MSDENLLAEIAHPALRDAATQIVRVLIDLSDDLAIDHDENGNAIYADDEEQPLANAVLIDESCETLDELISDLQSLVDQLARR